MKKVFKLIISIAACLLTGFIGSFFTASSVGSWYSTIAKPSFNPPSWVFGPVWTLLFILMGIAAYLVWDKGLKKKGVKQALTLFSVQLVFNIGWSAFFFGLKNPLLAFIEIIILWLLILTNIILFYKIDKRAAYLLVPYILWVSFASVLNLAIVLLN